MKFQTRSHSVFNLKIHRILVVAYRRKVINASIMNTLGQTVTEVCDSFSVRVIEFSGEMDHVHLLLETLPTIRISDLVRTIKSVTSCPFERTIGMKSNRNSGVNDSGLEVIVFYRLAME